MRIIAPIIKQEELTNGQTNTILETNFHSGLDAGYATSDGVLDATFYSSVVALDRRAGSLSGLRQVASLVQNFWNVLFQRGIGVRAGYGAIQTVTVRQAVVFYLFLGWSFWLSAV